MLPDFSNVFFSRVLRGISDTLVAKGYSLIIADTRNNPAREAQYAEFILAGRVDGVLLLNGRSSCPAARDTSDPDGQPVRADSGRPFPHVETENREVRAGDDALSRLARPPQHRILRGPITNVLEHERFAGYKDALREAGLKYDPALVTSGDFTLELGEVGGRRLYLSAARASRCDLRLQ